jgi:hypothetical protein
MEIWGTECLNGSAVQSPQENVNYGPEHGVTGFYVDTAKTFQAV